MNIKLICKDQSYNIDIMEETPSQYLYKIAQKIFRTKDIILFHGKNKIKNDSRLLFDIMKKNDIDDISPEEIITVKKIQELINKSGSKYKSLDKSHKTHSKRDKKISISEKIKKLPIRCQVCSKKNSIFYCRQCNLFVCFECNTRFSEHNRHKRINLDDGDTKLGMQMYKEKILEELSMIDSCYNKLTKWFITNTDRENLLTELTKLLEKIKKSSRKLSNVKVLYELNQKTLNNLKTEINEIKIPENHEDLFDNFRNLNTKDKEIQHYVTFVDLQILKAEFNKILFDNILLAENSLAKILDECEKKISDCKDMKYWSITEVKLYLKNQNNEQMNIDNLSETKKSFLKYPEAKNSLANIEDEMINKVKKLGHSKKYSNFQTLGIDNVDNKVSFDEKNSDSENNPNKNKRGLSASKLRRGSFSPKKQFAQNSKPKKNLKYDFDELLSRNLNNIDKNFNTGVSSNLIVLKKTDKIQLPSLNINNKSINNKLIQNSVDKNNAKSRRKSLMNALIPNFNENHDINLDGNLEKIINPIERKESSDINPVLLINKDEKNEELEEKNIKKPDNFSYLKDSSSYSKKLVQALRKKKVLSKLF